MSRVKKAVHARKFRRNLLRKTKGYRHARSKKERAAWEAYVHAGKYSFRDRRKKKSNFRRLWNVRINAALRAEGTTYSAFMGKLKKKNVAINRKILASIAAERPEVFKKVIAAVSSN